MTSPKVRSEEPTSYNTLFDVRQAHINRQIAAEWLDLNKEVAWHGGYVLDQLVLRHNEAGWLLIVKVYRNRTPYVSFVQAASMAEAIEYGGELASKGHLTWKIDEWPSRRLKELLGIK